MNYYEKIKIGDLQKDLVEKQIQSEYGSKSLPIIADIYREASSPSDFFKGMRRFFYYARIAYFNSQK